LNTKQVPKSVKEDRCWCGHLERWHHWTGICRWCARLELRRPEFNFVPRHGFATEIPERVKKIGDRLGK
jgi:hypothetical protein